MTIVHLALKYSGFAVLATLANLLAQEILIRLYADSYAIVVAMLAGTLAGWISKYLLDKHYIFDFQSNSPRQDFKKFLSYGLTGVLTHRGVLELRTEFRVLLCNQVGALPGCHHRTVHRIWCKVSPR